MHLALVIVVVTEGPQQQAAGAAGGESPPGRAVRLRSSRHQGPGGLDRVRRHCRLASVAGGGRRGVGLGGFGVGCGRIGLVPPAGLRRRQAAEWLGRRHVVGPPLEKHDVLEAEGALGQVGPDREHLTPAIEDVPGRVERGVVAVGKGTAGEGVLPDEGDAVLAHLLADPAVAPDALRVHLEIIERLRAVEGEHHVAARLGDPPELGQPRILVGLVDVGEDAVVVDEVEGGIRIVERRERGVDRGGDAGEVGPDPADGPLVDVDTVQRRGRRRLSCPQQDAAAAAAELEDRLVGAE